MKDIVLFMALFSLAWGQNQDEEVTFSLFATDLKGCDDLSACDTEIKIMCASLSSDWRECGKATEMGDDNFPLFPQLFTKYFVPSEMQRWKFDVVDKDVLFDDPIGSVTVSVADFLETTKVQATMHFDLPDNRGRLYIHKRKM